MFHLHLKMISTYLQMQFNYYLCTSHITYVWNQKITTENIYGWMTFIVLAVNTCRLVFALTQIGVVPLISTKVQFLPAEQLALFFLVCFVSVSRWRQFKNTDMIWDFLEKLLTLHYNIFVGLNETVKPGIKVIRLHT